MAYRELSCEKMGYCKIVRFLRPTNARGWFSRLANELEDLCAEVNWDEDSRVLLLVYRGKDFNSKAEEDAQEGKDDWAFFVESVARMKQPVIAAVDGDAMGTGLELALACDIRIGTEGSRFGLPHICDGLIPSAGGTQRLPRLVGRGKALEMILTGEAIDAAEARRIGLFHRIVPATELVDAATGLATEMAARSPLAMSYVKEALHSGQDLTIDQGMRLELDLYLLLFSTLDRIEGISAFNEKRKPEFKGE